MSAKDEALRQEEAQKELEALYPRLSPHELNVYNFLVMAFNTDYDTIWTELQNYIRIFELPEYLELFAIELLESGKVPYEHEDRKYTWVQNEIKRLQDILKLCGEKTPSKVFEAIDHESL